MKTWRIVGVIAFLASALPATVQASSRGEYFPPAGDIFNTTLDATATIGRPWQVSFITPAVAPPLQVESAVADAVAQDNQRPVAFEYSDAYNRRRSIHMIASYATLPLFVAQYFVGEKLFDEPDNSSAKSAHGALTIGIATLFAVNTVTGGWNLWEARKDPNGRTSRLIHGLMMMGASAGFVATGALAPDDDGDSSRSTHRNVAIGSMGVAAASYIYMLVTR